MLTGLDHICFYDDPCIPTSHCAWLCKRWVCIVGIPPEKAAIGSAGLSGGSDRVDTRIWFAY